MKTIYRLCVLGLSAHLLVPAAFGAHTQARLILSRESARPGETVLAGVQLKMDFGWHTYWQNSGDSGDRTKIEWTLPAGITAGEILWPPPEKSTVADFVTYDYHDEVVLLVPLKLAADLPVGPRTLEAKVSWLECEKTCVPGKADVQATLKIGDESKPSTEALLVETWRQKLPLIKPGLLAQAWWEKPAENDSRPAILEWLDAANDRMTVDFYPFRGEGFDVQGATEQVLKEAGKVRLRKVVKKLDGDWPARMDGLLIQQSAGSPKVAAYEVHLPILAAQPRASGGGLDALPSLVTLLGKLGLAFLGGLILNIMPCVLPVIALKIFGFVSQSKEAPGRVRALGLVYGLGVLASFLVLALVAIAVQKAGGLASWGMVLQNQAVRVVLTVVITLVALNLFGVFEVTLGSGVMGAASGLAAKHGFAGAFFNGVLATILATPCTAPFLSAALAFAFTQPPVVTLLVFLTVGLGLAAPFAVLCWQPAWLKFLPKPGAWMEKFKIAMGFPMLATAVWLFWFTAPRFGKSGVLWLGLFLVILAAAAWVWGEFVQRGSRRRGLAIVVSLVLVALGYAYALEGQLKWRSPVQPAQSGGSLKSSPDGIDWKGWSPEAVAKARAEGRPILVDFTADNCLNCQLNKVTSLEIPATRAKLKEINAVSLLGDFTDQDPLIAAELKRYGRPGVPLVLVYPRAPNTEPIVLPEILTPGIVSDALDKAVK